MTEDEWRTCAEPEPMLAFLLGRGATERKLRLAGVATYRRVLEVFVGTHWRDAAGLVEGWADGRDPAAGATATARYHAICNHSQHDPEVYLASAVVHLAGAAEAFRPDLAVDCCATAYGNTLAWYGGAWHPEARGRYEQEVEGWAAAAIRDIFGSPFSPAQFDPSWRTENVILLARAMYESKDFSAATILADALDEAGCDDERLLNHLRGPNVHVRGCWSIDLVLEKE